MGDRLREKARISSSRRVGLVRLREDTHCGGSKPGELERSKSDEVERAQ